MTSDLAKPFTHCHEVALRDMDVVSVVVIVPAVIPYYVRETVTIADTAVFVAKMAMVRRFDGVCEVPVGGVVEVKYLCAVEHLCGFFVDLLASLEKGDVTRRGQRFLAFIFDTSLPVSSWVWRYRGVAQYWLEVEKVDLLSKLDGKAEKRERHIEGIMK